LKSILWVRKMKHDKYMERRKWNWSKDLKLLDVLINPFYGMEK